MTTTKDEPYTDSRFKPATAMSELFGTLKSYLRLCGYYYKVDTKEGKSAFKRQTLNVLYCVFCNLCALFNAFRFAFVFGNFSKYSSNSFTLIAYFFFHVGIAFMSVTLTLSLPNNLNHLTQLFKARYEKHSTQCPRLKVITHVSFCIFLFLALLIHVGKFILQETILPDIPRLDPPFDQLDQSYRNLGIFFDAVITLCGSSGYYVLIVVYNVISYCIFKEFSLFSSKFKILYNGSKSQFELKFQELWDEHVSICDVLQQTEKFLKHFVSILYLATMPVFCFVVYGLANRRLPAVEFGFVAIIFVFCICQIANITLVGIYINEKAHEPLQHIFHSKWTSFSDETVQKISLFVTRLSADRIGYSAYGLFTIDRSTILMVCGTTLTYVVVVLQLQTDSTCHENILKNINLTQLCP